MNEKELSVIRKTYDLVKWSNRAAEVSWDRLRPNGPVGPSPG